MNRSTILTATGIEVDLAAPHDAEIRVEDVAHALARVSRFGGHYPHEDFFSVARHSLAVEAILAHEGAPYQTRLAGLLHDASEAYLGDVVRPLKRLLPEYVVIERAWQSAIEKTFGLPPYSLSWADVKRADEIALAWENAACGRGDLGPLHDDRLVRESGFSIEGASGGIAYLRDVNGAIPFPDVRTPRDGALAFLSRFSFLRRVSDDAVGSGA